MLARIQLIIFGGTSSAGGGGGGSTGQPIGLLLILTQA